MIKHVPAGLWPRGMSRSLAAKYIGVGVTKFDEMVKDGRMPRARRIDCRKVWDCRELDDAFDALPHDGEDDEGENPWDKIAA
ncbi:MAG: hypothetical protein GXP04_12275 [Alphaproteobacteria bacterium]|nr:hypothetical protein [Alphaproteobacteria bacterium]